MAELSIENRRSSLLLEGSELPEKIKAYIEEHRKLVEWVSNRDKQS